MKKFSFNFSDELAERIEQEAARLTDQRGIRHTVSDLVRMAVEAWLKKQANRKTPWKLEKK